MQPRQCDSQKTRNTTRLKCYACHAEWRWRSPKCCTSHQKCNSSSDNDAKVLRLPHKMNSEMLWNMLECHKVPRLPRETKLRDAWNLQKEPLLQNSPIGTAALTRTVANGCGRLRTVTQPLANTASIPKPPWQSETGTLATQSGTRDDDTNDDK